MNLDYQINDEYVSLSYNTLEIRSTKINIYVTFYQKNKENE